MFKYRWNLPYYLEVKEGVKKFEPVDGVLELPVEVKGLTLIEGSKRDLNKEAELLGLEGEDLAKFKRKNKEAKEKFLEKLKEGK